MSYTLFSGCSYTAGNGFALEKEDPALWVNQLYQQFFSRTQKINVSKGGRSNAGIFQDTISALVSYPVEYAFVEWTSVPRYELELGLETYCTTQMFIPNCDCLDHSLNTGNYSKEYLNSIRDRFTSLSHNHGEIVNLLNYANSISKLCELTKTKVFFINGMCCWDANFFVKKIDVLSNEYTPYTRHLLNVDNRDDDEIFIIYNKIHQQYLNTGGIREALWLNLYSSMRNLRIDVNDDNTHPGIESNLEYVDLFSRALNAKL